MLSIASNLSSSHKASIILRTKNEEKWLKACINSIRSQTWKNYEIILVDNGSTDATVKSAKALGVDKITFIDEYKPGAALNLGVSAGDGEICVFLSAHCVPCDIYWLEKLVSPIALAEVQAVYGRQIPTSKTTPDNCRDLLMTFGQESFKQCLDIKFHNANSAVAREVLEKYPFDEDISNIEDWIWARNLIGRGFEIKYQADALVFHHHGINQHDEHEESFRAGKVSKILHGLYYPIEIEEPFFAYENWNTLIVLSRPERSDLAKIKDDYGSLDVVAVNAPASSESLNCMCLEVDRELGFLSYLKAVLNSAENATGQVYDSVCFVDFSYSNIELNFIEENISALYSNWADVCSVGRQITGKTFNLNKLSEKNVKGEIFPSNKQESSLVELVLGYCGAMRASVIRNGEGRHLDYYVSGLLDHHSTIKVSK